LAWGLAHTSAPLGWAGAALLIAAICGGICVFVGLSLLQATLTFWTLQGIEATHILNYGGAEASSFPVHIYDRWLKRMFLAFVPIATATYFPVLSVLHKTDPFGLPPFTHALAPLAGPIFLAVTLFFWHLGLRRYASTGS
jgi:ABC-2 type transport system permease protein